MSKELIRRAINGAFGRARFVQETPILPDVWSRYLDLADSNIAPMDQLNIEAVNRRADLLLTSAAGSEPGMIAKELRKGLKSLGADVDAAGIAHNRTTVAAELSFSELVCVVVPMTQWWRELPIELQNFDRAKISLFQSFPHKSSTEVEFFTFATTAGLLGLLLRGHSDEAISLAETLVTARGITADLKPLLEEYRKLAHGFEFSTAPLGATVGRVQLNRPGYLSVYQSRQTIKADACHNLFKGSAAKIKWAVVDCGIDATHPAFGPTLATSRVVKTYDFTKVRNLLSGKSTTDAAGRPLDPGLIAQLAAQNAAGRQVDWSLIKEAVTIPHAGPNLNVMGNYRPPTADHGTHVAGIIGADWAKDPNNKPVIWICPDISLIDVRVFDSNTADEFNVIAALQFIGYLNRVSEVPEIHGVNISFSFAHDVRNYACGRTPICSECERLIDNGVVVVAAAGNAGYSRSGAAPSLDDRYATMTITDPGNAPSVITVGSTHRTQPHTYGVSFFSSRGPTGDGRAKPDLIAPGEKILSTTINAQSGEKDGTSMAAPHVSGAAAIVMTRNAELIGKPRLIKDILCRSATDLGRERSFQGAGIVDVLRALQSI